MYRNYKILGLTLVEIVAVISIISILMGILIPVVNSHLDNQKKEKAKKDVQNIAKAIIAFYSTTDMWPTMDEKGRLNRVKILITGYSIPRKNPWKTNNGFWFWIQNNGCDLLANHLISNSPKGQRSFHYPRSGKYRWRGPYIDNSTLDPWGRPYVINIISVYSNDPIKFRRMWVLSAGPDGIFQTPYKATLADDISGDDIGILVKQR